jgi:hypothetical protein
VHSSANVMGRPNGERVVFIFHGVARSYPYDLNTASKSHLGNQLPPFSRQRWLSIASSDLLVYPALKTIFDLSPGTAMTQLPLYIQDCNLHGRLSAQRHFLRRFSIPQKRSAHSVQMFACEQRVQLPCFTDPLPHNCEQHRYFYCKLFIVKAALSLGSAC